MERLLDDRVAARHQRLHRTDVHTLPGGFVVGFADVGPVVGDDPRCDGELYAIYVLRRRQ